LTGSHKAPSGHAITGTSRLHNKLSQAKQASVITSPHPVSQRRTSQWLPFEQTIAFDVLFACYSLAIFPVPRCRIHLYPPLISCSKKEPSASPTSVNETPVAPS
jgi:hypothetical protein